MIEQKNTTEHEWRMNPEWMNEWMNDNFIYTRFGNWMGKGPPMSSAANSYFAHSNDWKRTATEQSCIATIF